MMAAVKRIYAMFLRHWYILRSSPARVLEIMYWPSIQMVLWGFISRFFAFQEASTLHVALGTLLGAVLLWDLLFRSQLGVSFSYMEEQWSRNLAQVFISPLRFREWAASMILFSVMRASVGIFPALVLAIPFYGFSVFELGLPVVFLFFNVMFMGWWLGMLVTALLIRTGPGAESLAWAMTFMLAPLCAVYYPVDILPVWLQPLAHALPASHVFEALREVVTLQTVPWDMVWRATAMNTGYMVFALFVLHMTYRSALRDGLFLRNGE
ncbi:MAG: ABC transporter permease [Alphaproteobacteria bacterium]|nr:ABC transporter permease [Alphaproteobacteria bacterium]